MCKMNKNAQTVIDPSDNVMHLLTALPHNTSQTSWAAELRQNFK